MKIYFSDNLRLHEWDTREGLDRIRISNIKSAKTGDAGKNGRVPLKYSYSVDNKMVTYVGYLENNKDFERGVKEIRRKFGIPNDIHNTDDLLNFYKGLRKRFRSSSAKNKFWTGLAKESSALAKEFKLPGPVERALLQIILENRVSRSLQTVLEIKINDESEGASKNLEIKINLFSKTTREQMLNIIKNNWTQINDLLDFLPEENEISDSLERLEVLRLRDVKKLTFSEIAEEINKSRAEKLANKKGRGCRTKQFKVATYHTVEKMYENARRERDSLKR